MSPSLAYFPDPVIDNLFRAFKTPNSFPLLSWFPRKDIDIPVFSKAVDEAKGQGRSLPFKETFRLDCQNMSMQDMNTFAKKIPALSIPKIEFSLLRRNHIYALARTLVTDNESVICFPVEFDFSHAELPVDSSILDEIAVLLENNSQLQLNFNTGFYEKLKEFPDEAKRISRHQADNRKFLLAKIQELISINNVDRIDKIFANASLRSNYDFAGEDLLSYAIIHGKYECAAYFISHSTKPSLENLKNACNAAYANNSIAFADKITSLIAKKLQRRQSDLAEFLKFKDIIIASAKAFEFKAPLNIGSTGFFAPKTKTTAKSADSKTPTTLRKKDHDDTGTRAAYSRPQDTP